MTEQHDIARHFSEAARRVAAKHIYSAAPNDPGGPPRNAFGQCPVGVMLEIDFPRDRGLHDDPLACSVQEAFDAHAREEWVFDAARDFIYRWDSGAIPDLYAALGVEREAPP